MEDALDFILRGNKFGWLIYKGVKRTKNWITVYQMTFIYCINVCLLYKSKLMFHQRTHDLKRECSLEKPPSNCHCFCKESFPPKSLPGT